MTLTPSQKKKQAPKALPNPNLFAHGRMWFTVRYAKTYTSVNIPYPPMKKMREGC